MFASSRPTTRRATLLYSAACAARRWTTSRCRRAFRSASARPTGLLVVAPRRRRSPRYNISRLTTPRRRLTTEPSAAAIGGADVVAPSPAGPGVARLRPSDACRIAGGRSGILCASPPWAAWIRTLPATFDTPLFWSADERAWRVGPTHAGALTAMLERRLASDWETSRAALSRTPTRAARGAAAGAARDGRRRRCRVGAAASHSRRGTARARTSAALVPMLDLLSARAAARRCGDERRRRRRARAARRGARARCARCLSHVDGADGERALVSARGAGGGARR